MECDITVRDMETFLLGHHQKDGGQLETFWKAHVELVAALQPKQNSLVQFRKIMVDSVII